MKINELEQLTGIPRATIRYYEREGLIKPVRNPSNDYRKYSDTDLENLKKIIILRKLGISIDEIKAVIDGEETLTEVIGKQIKTLEQQQTELIAALDMCAEIMQSEPTLEDFDVDHYWTEMHEKEAHGQTFLDYVDADLTIATSNISKYVEVSQTHGPRTPDVIVNPMKKQGDRIRSYWQEHRILQTVLMILIILVSFWLVLSIGES